MPRLRKPVPGVDVRPESPGLRLRVLPRRPGREFSRHAPDARAQLGELLLDTFITAVNVIDAIDDVLAFRHQARQRVSVRTLTPSSSRRRAARAAVMPSTIAVTNTTTAPRYTRRPRYRTEGGVVRRRQPSCAQQKLNRVA